MKTLAALVVLLIASSIAVGQDLPGGAVTKEIDLRNEFGASGGCFVLFDCGKNQYLQYNPDGCRTRYSPCSTFKIPNSLIALETGVADDTSFVIRYDGARHPIESELLNKEPFKHWPRDQSMKSAFHFSVVWYYQEIAARIGKARMQRYLDSLNYGNRDISSGIDHFWLGGSMKISANEQVDFIVKLVNDHLDGFSKIAQEKVKAIMLAEATDRYKIYGKTGTCSVGTDSTIAWYVGFVETQSNTYAFALNIIVRLNDELATKRLELVKKIFQNQGIL